MQEFFFDEDSREGEFKRSLLGKQMVVCLKRDDTIPPFRATWEFIQEVIATRKRRTLEILNTTAETAPVGEAFSKINTMEPLGFLVSQVDKVFPEFYPVYEPRYGFDLDPFILFHLKSEAFEVAVEFFPRDSEKPVQAFGSYLKDSVTVPRIGLPGFRENTPKDVLFMELVLSILTEGKGVSGPGECPAIDAWAKRGGSIAVPKSKEGEFLSNVALALIVKKLGVELPLITPVYKEDKQGLPKDAFLHRSAASPKDKSPIPPEEPMPPAA